MLIPEISDALPRRGNGFSRWLGRMWLRVFRWRIEGEICPAAKSVFVMAPHTSWWDFTLNFGVLLALGIHVSWFIADKYTRGIAGKCLAHFGAVPVDRSERSNMVTQMAGHFINREKFLLAIFPEGTRKPVARWKSGFWHIARQAGVPVQLVAVDYARRATVFGPILVLSDDMDADIQHMRAHFKPIVARHPENALYTD
jgi:1-acyl-sn-glycerol-3-phosphate acyltransferase